MSTVASLEGNYVCALPLFSLFGHISTTNIYYFRIFVVFTVPFNMMHDWKQNRTILQINVGFIQLWYKQ